MSASWYANATVVSVIEGWKEDRESPAWVISFKEAAAKTQSSFSAFGPGDLSSLDKERET